MISLSYLFENEYILPQSKVTKSDIKAHEKQTGYALPHDFKQFLKKSNGSAPKLENVGDHVVDHFHSFSRSDKYNAHHTHEALKSRLPEGNIPFASDPGGNHFVFSYKNKKDPPIVSYWDHEEADPKLAIKHVSPSFTHFQASLK
jgi:hypothetical protein